MNESLIKNWNERVKPEDTVFFLGDFSFKSTNKSHLTIYEPHGSEKGNENADYWKSKLQGNIIFVKGNHDGQSNGLKTIIDCIHVTFAQQRIHMTHKPEHADPRFPITLCGHVHCFDTETEILTAAGWKKYTEIVQGEQIISLDTVNNTLVVNPIKEVIISDHIGNLINYNSSHNFTMTSNHRIYCKRERRDVWESIEIGKLCPYKDSHFSMRVSGNSNKIPLDLTDDELRLCVWITTDGSIEYKKSGMYIRFGIAKERKIKRLTALLGRLGIQLSFLKRKMGKGNRLQPYRFNLLGFKNEKILSLFRNEKQLPQEFRNLSKDQVSILLEEYSHTDGTCYDHGIQLATSKKAEADLLQELCALNGHSCKESHKLQINKKNIRYILSIVLNKDTLMYNTKHLQAVPYAGKVWCVTVDKDTVITRRNGNVLISHNSKWRIRYFKEHYKIIEDIVSKGTDIRSDRQDFKDFLERNYVHRNSDSVLLNVGVDVQNYRPVTLDECIGQVIRFKKGLLK
jgi:calcineurin-like phosphoesterase family protein